MRYDENYFYQEEFGVKYIALGKSDVYFEFDTNNEDIDCAALEHGYITIVPLFNDQIKHDYIDEVKKIYTK